MPINIHDSPEGAREAQDKFDLAERARAVLRATGKGRLKLIEAAEDSEALVRALPAPELWLTIKEIGEEDAIELVRMAAPEQLQHILDLECWRQDTLDPLAVAYWLMLITHAGSEAVTAWFNQADEEFLVAALAHFFQVFRSDPDDQGMEPWRELDHLWTADDVYYVHVPDPKLAPVVEQLLAVIRDSEPVKYYGLLDLVDQLPAVEEEEKAYRFRMARLADYGFAEPEESLLIYAPLSDRELAGLLANAPAPKEAWIAPPSAASENPLARGELPELFSRALALIDDPDAVSDLQIGMATLINRILIADDMNLARAESVFEAMTKAHTFVELGLRRWAHGDPAKAAHLLRTQHAFLIFRAGFTELLQLGRAAHRLTREGWPARVRPGLELMGEDGRVVAGLTRPRPRLHAGTDKQGAPLLAEFRAEQDLARARTALYRTEVLGRIFLEGLDVPERELLILKEHCASGELSFETALTTALGHEMIGAGLRFAPLTADEARSALKKMLTPETPRQVVPAVRDQLAGRLDRALARRADFGDPDRAEARRFLDRCLHELESETRDLDLKDLDPRFFKSMIIIPGMR